MRRVNTETLYSQSVNVGTASEHSKIGLPVFDSLHTGGLLVWGAAVSKLRNLAFPKTAQEYVAAQP